VNRKDRRAEARRRAKGRDERKVIARALKTIEIADAPPAQEPYPELRASGFVVAGPRLEIGKEAGS
jgi:hypothetical protein